MLLTGPRHPRPPAQPDVSAQIPPDQLEQHEKLQLGQAANRAKAIYPGVVGEILASELEAARDFRMRFHNDSRTARLVRHLMTAQVPSDAA